MKDALTPIDQAGRIVLPKNVREELAIKPGDTFKVSIRGTTVTLTLNVGSTGFVRKGKALVFTTVGEETMTNETVIGILDAGRQEREASSIGNLPKRKRG